MLAVIDYGAGNLRSVQKACEHEGANVVVTSDKNKILNADRVILPGVGAFGDCMKAICEKDLLDCILKVCENGTPFLGICLGLQLLFEESEESPNIKGLSLLNGNNIKIPKKDGLKIPHIGWNSLNFKKPCKLFDGIKENSFVYFVHSYHMNPADKSIITASCDYPDEIPVALCRDNICAVQFHPEKSGETGLKILNNFISKGGDM